LALFRMVPQLGPTIKFKDWRLKLDSVVHNSNAIGLGPWGFLE